MIPARTSFLVGHHVHHCGHGCLPSGESIAAHSLVLLVQVGNNAEQDEGEVADVAPGSVGQHRESRVDKKLTFFEFENGRASNER